MKPISLTSNGEKIVGNLFVADKHQKLAFLFLHGWLGHQNIAAAQALANLGFTSMTYDMRGSGKSEGDLSNLTRADFLADAAFAYDYLKQATAGTSDIGVVGSSFGCYLATLLSEKRDIFCLSLRVPANYPDEALSEPGPTSAPAQGQYNEWRNRQLDFTQSKTLNALHNFRGKVQIIEAEKDEIVPHQTLVNYTNAVQDKNKVAYSVMASAPHSLANESLRLEYVRLLSEWAKQFLS